jgi:hypothetical protein
MHPKPFERFFDKGPFFPRPQISELQSRAEPILEIMKKSAETQCCNGTHGDPGDAKI